jgi:putative FmdB family regulatory protein
LPTYGYRCTECKTEFERFQKITDPPVTVCESCGAPVKKIIYPVGIQFKGPGFYVTDYKGAGKEPVSSKPADSGASADSSKATESSSTTDTSKTTESKSETSSTSSTSATATETKAN